MRLRHPDGQTVHLAYCTNVHPAEDLGGVIAQLSAFAEPVRRRLDTDVLGLGVWLAAPAAGMLAADPRLRRLLRGELDARGLEVVSVNGFPYAAFHAPVVKQAVYHPDWTDPRRLTYTLDLARVLVDLLPDDAARGSISTLPLGWREPWRPDHTALAARHLDQLAAGLAELEERSGRTVRIAFEPEPGCVIETTDQATTALSDVDSKYLGVCVDFAHLACAWESPEEALRGYERAGLPVVKAQLSAALEVAAPAEAAGLLAAYAEPRFLHQTRSAAGDAYDDLPQALDSNATGPWRIHYHVPLHAQPAPPLTSTTPFLRAGLKALVGGESALSDHLEVETYTWGVLPTEQRPADRDGLVAGVAAELAFARAQLLALGLREG